MEERKTFDVRDYGAKGDGVTDDTAALQRAVNDCGAAGGGVVSFPDGAYRVVALDVGELPGLTLKDVNLRVEG